MGQPDAIVDVPGVAVGHAQRTGRGWRTGTTVVVTAAGATAGVDVRGGGPGTHETDLLRPENLVQQVHAVCLTGGSAYGLAAAGGVMDVLEQRGVGFPVGVDGSGVVPIVPAAVIYDLGRGGVFTNRPDAGFGAAATRRASTRQRTSGTLGAGAGAIAGGVQGGVGTASELLPSGVVVGAIVVVNSVGTVIDPTTGLPWETDDGMLDPPRPGERRRLGTLLGARPAPLNTTIGCVATSASLTKAECTKMATVAHDGLARAIRPAHSLFDGDTIFALATGASPGPTAGDPRTAAILADEVFQAGARVFARACTRAVVEASGQPGGPPSYADVCPSAFRRRAAGR